MNRSSFDKKMKKVTRNKKRKGTELPEAETTETFVSAIPNDVNTGKNIVAKKRNKLKKKKTNKEKQKAGDREDVLQSNEDGDYSNEQSDNQDGANSNKKINKAARKNKRKSTELPEIVVSMTPDDANGGRNSIESSNPKRNKLKKKKKDKESRKMGGTLKYPQQATEDSKQQCGNSKSASQMENDATLLEDDDEVYQISSGDEDETTGMKRWITKYHRARPGANVLMERINDYLVDYWAQKEKEKKEKEEEAAEGGWTVVTHLKGRKKTTDSESGTTVGSVAQAAVMDKMSKKKDKQVGVGFYSFQKREAQRNEIMMLQSKFEQDKKRIQQMRAARKFRPY